MTAIAIFAKAQNPIQEGRVAINSTLADTILSTMNYRGQRRLKAPHTRTLAAMMRRKAWMPGSQIAFARINGHLVLVNGQHRRAALVETGTEAEFQVVIHDCADDAAVAKLYYHFDRAVGARTDSDVLSSVGIAERFDMMATATRAIWQAVPIIANGFQRVSYANDEARRDDDLRLSQCEAWWKHGARFEALLSEAPSHVRKAMLRAQTTAVAMTLLRWQPEEANKFILGIAEDDGLRRDDPRKAFLIDLMQRPFRRVSLDGCITMANAWNAFYRGRTTTHLKVMANAKVRIEGTPYDGRR